MSRVLVFDDEATICSQVERALFGQVDVVTATSMAQAEAAIAEDGVSVVIQDLVLPGPKGGYDFIETHCGPGSGRQAIAITGFVEQANMDRLMDAGAYCFLKKDFDFDELKFATKAAQRAAARHNEALRATLGVVIDAVEEWARAAHDDPETRPVLIGGRRYAPDDLAREVRRLSYDGRTYLKGLLSCTADLIARGRVPLAPEEQPR